MNYTNWLINLLDIIILETNFSLRDISITEEEVKGYWEQGVLPNQVFYDIWDQYAGNYFKI